MRRVRQLVRRESGAENMGETADRRPRNRARTTEMMDLVSGLIGGRKDGAGGTGADNEGNDETAERTKKARNSNASKRCDTQKKNLFVEISCRCTPHTTHQNLLRWPNTRGGVLRYRIGNHRIGGGRQRRGRRLMRYVGGCNGGQVTARRRVGHARLERAARPDSGRHSGDGCQRLVSDRNAREVGSRRSVGAGSPRGDRRHWEIASGLTRRVRAFDDAEQSGREVRARFQ